MKGLRGPLFEPVQRPQWDRVERWDYRTVSILCSEAVQEHEDECQCQEP